MAVGDCLRPKSRIARCSQARDIRTIPMTEEQLAEIETALRVTLPEEYRRLMRSRAEVLQTAGCFDGDLSPFFVRLETVIDHNTSERETDAGTAEAFPNWWQTFFLVGTNGAGDYYC